METEKNRKSGRNKSYNGWKKNTNGNKQATLVESLELFGRKNENDDSLHISHENETTNESTKMFIGLKEIDAGKDDSESNSFGVLLPNNNHNKKSRTEKNVMKRRKLNESCTSSSEPED